MNFFFAREKTLGTRFLMSPRRLRTTGQRQQRGQKFLDHLGPTLGPPSFPSMSQEKLFYLIHTMTQQNVYKRLTRTMSKYVETKAPSWLKKLIYFRLESTAVQHHASDLTSCHFSALTVKKFSGEFQCFLAGLFCSQFSDSMF